jgi:hypothetical protein
MMCLSVMVLGAGYVRAQELISARVLSSKGQVEIRRRPDDQPRIQKIAFKVDDELKAGDTIITGKSGRLVLGLSDGSQAVIAPQTTVVIKDLSQSPRTLFNVIRGKTRVHIEKLGGQPNPYRVNTPTAVIAVRGTIFDVLVEEDETQVFLHEGAVAVTSLTAPDKAVFLLAGQMTRVLMWRLPNAPILFKAGRNDGTFKVGIVDRNDGAPRVNRRVAVNGPRPNFGRDGPGSNSGARPGVGRDGAIVIGGAKPDFGRGGGSSNGPVGPGPNTSQRTAGKKP